MYTAIRIDGLRSAQVPLEPARGGPAAFTITDHALDWLTGQLDCRFATPADSRASLLPVRHRLASHPLEHRRDTLPAADAHSYQRIASANPLQLVQRLHRKDATRGTDRMAKRNAGSIRIGLRRIETEVLRHGTSLRGERLIALDHVDLAQRQTGPLQREPRCRHRPDPHDLRIDTRMCISHQPTHRL